MAEINYYCRGCFQMISEEEFNNGKKECTREGCLLYGKPLTVIMRCRECNAYFPPNTTHHHILPGIGHYPAPNRISDVKARYSGAWMKDAI